MYLIYPLLLCVIPIESIYSQNFVDISFKSFMSAVLLMGIIEVFAFFAINFFLNKPDLSALLVCFLFFILFYGNHIFIGLNSQYRASLKKTKIKFLIGYIAFIILTVYVLGFCFKNVDLSFLSKILFGITLFLNLCVISDIVKRTSNVQKSDEVLKDLKIDDENLPTIFHIVLDAHTGFYSDDFCDEQFKNELLKRGFVNFKNPRSNYNRTHVSMPSIMNLDYIQDVLNLDLKHCQAQNTMFAYSDNFVFRVFNQLGYKINFITNAVSEKIASPLVKKNGVCLVNGQVALIFVSIFFSSIFALFFKMDRYKSYKSFLKKAFKKFGWICENRQTDKSYNFVHFLAPHYPYFWDEDGNELERGETLKNANYGTYQKYIDKKTLEYVDLILKNQNKNTLIIIHGDHGIHDTKNEFNTLLSIYFPDKNEDVENKEITLVNLFRIIFNRYLKTNYMFLEDRFFKTDNNKKPLVEVKK